MSIRMLPTPKRWHELAASKAAKSGDLLAFTTCMNVPGVMVWAWTWGLGSVCLVIQNLTQRGDYVMASLDSLCACVLLLILVTIQRQDVRSCVWVKLWASLRVVYLTAPLMACTNFFVPATKRMFLEKVMAFYLLPILFGVCLTILETLPLSMALVSAAVESFVVGLTAHASYKAGYHTSVIWHASLYLFVRVTVTVWMHNSTRKQFQAHRQRLGVCSTAEESDMAATAAKAGGSKAATAEFSSSAVYTTGSSDGGSSSKAFLQQQEQQRWRSAQAAAANHASAAPYGAPYTPFDTSLRRRSRSGHNKLAAGGLPEIEEVADMPTDCSASVPLPLHAAAEQAPARQPHHGQPLPLPQQQPVLQIIAELMQQQAAASRSVEPLPFAPALRGSAAPAAAAAPADNERVLAAAREALAAVVGSGPTLVYTSPLQRMTVRLKIDHCEPEQLQPEALVGLQRHLAGGAAAAAVGGAGNGSASSGTPSWIITSATVRRGCIELTVDLISMQQPQPRRHRQQQQQCLPTARGSSYGGSCTRTSCGIAATTASSTCSPDPIDSSLVTVSTPFDPISDLLDSDMFTSEGSLLQLDRASYEGTACSSALGPPEEGLKSSKWFDVPFDSWLDSLGLPCTGPDGSGHMTVQVDTDPLVVTCSWLPEEARWEREVLSPQVHQVRRSTRSKSSGRAAAAAASAAVETAAAAAGSEAAAAGPGAAAAAAHGEEAHPAVAAAPAAPAAAAAAAAGAGAGQAADDLGLPLPPRKEQQQQLEPQQQCLVHLEGVAPRVALLPDLAPTSSQQQRQQSVNVNVLLLLGGGSSACAGLPDGLQLRAHAQGQPCTVTQQRVVASNSNADGSGSLLMQLQLLLPAVPPLLRGAPCTMHVELCAWDGLVLGRAVTLLLPTVMSQLAAELSAQAAQEQGASGEQLQQLRQGHEAFCQDLVTFSEYCHAHAVLQLHGDELLYYMGGSHHARLLVHACREPATHDTMCALGVHLLQHGLACRLEGTAGEVLCCLLHTFGQQSPPEGSGLHAILEARRGQREAARCQQQREREQGAQRQQRLRQNKEHADAARAKPSSADAGPPPPPSPPQKPQGWKLQKGSAARAHSPALAVAAAPPQPPSPSPPAPAAAAAAAAREQGAPAVADACRRPPCAWSCRGCDSSPCDLSASDSECTRARVSGDKPRARRARSKSSSARIELALDLEVDGLGSVISYTVQSGRAGRLPAVREKLDPTWLSPSGAYDNRRTRSLSQRHLKLLQREQLCSQL